MSKKDELDKKKNTISLDAFNKLYDNHKERIEKLEKILQEHFKQTIENNKRHIEIIRDKYENDDDWELYVAEQERVIEQKKGLLEKLGGEKLGDDCLYIGELGNCWAEEEKGDNPCKPHGCNKYEDMKPNNKVEVRLGGGSYTETPYKEKEPREDIANAIWNSPMKSYSDLVFRQYEGKLYGMPKGFSYYNDIDHKRMLKTEFDNGYKAGLINATRFSEYKENTWVLVKMDGRTEIYGAKYFKLVRIEHLEQYKCRECHQIFSILQEVKTEGTQITWCPFCKSYNLEYLTVKKE